MAGAKVVDEYKLDEILGSRNIRTFKREYIPIDYSIYCQGRVKWMEMLGEELEDCQVGLQQSWKMEGKLQNMSGK